MRNTPITFQFTKSDFITIFKACEDRRQKLDTLQRTSDDEDKIADAGNSLIEVNLMIKELKARADEQWGETGWTASEEYL